MRIALAYDLRDEYLAAGFGDEETAEFDRVETIEAIEAALCELGHKTERVGHLRSLMQCEWLSSVRRSAGKRYEVMSAYCNRCDGAQGGKRLAPEAKRRDAFQVLKTTKLAGAVLLHCTNIGEAP